MGEKKQFHQSLSDILATFSPFYLHIARYAQIKAAKN